PPLILGGSHDPLLEWAVHQSDCGLAQLACGSLEGLARLARGDVMAAGCHVYEAETKTFNQATAQRLLVGHGMVLITWAWRRQGLIVAAGNPLGLSSLADLAPTDGPRPRLVTRQAAAGSTILLRHLAEVAGIDGDSLNSGAVPARTHSDMAAAILRGEADAGLGVEAAAAPFGLDFVPLFRERFDLAMRRRDYFADPVQRLLAFAGGPQFDGHAAGLHGYDTGELGRVVWNDR
ncbi:MAG: substrate-binding domain-containing protein, partial [Alphaproteobacteria bacterium]